MNVLRHGFSGLALLLLSVVGAEAQSLGQAPGPGYVPTSTSVNSWAWELPSGGGGGILNMMPAYTYLCNPTNVNGVPAQACPPFTPLPPLFLDTNFNNLSLRASWPNLDTYAGQAAGVNAPTASGSGGSNTGMGAFALFTNNGGSSNSAFGEGSLFVLTTGVNNTAMGNNSGAAITTGTNNTAIGSGAMGSLTTGINNVGIGINVGTGIVTGSNNTILGDCTYAADLTSTVAICDGIGNVILDHSKTTAGVTSLLGPVASSTTLQAKTVFKASGPALPTCNAAAEGTWAAVSDAPAVTFNTAYAPGGGTNHMPVYCNGTAWTIH